LISIAEHETIVDVDRAGWDRLAGEDVFSSYGWLRTSEETSRVVRRHRYFLAHASDGLAGAAACYLDETKPSTVDGVLFGRVANRARALRLTVAPALVCGTRTGLGGHILVRPDSSESDRRRVMLALLDAMEASARGDGWTLCFRSVVDRSTSLVESLRSRRYARAAELPTTFLDVRWSSFDDYIRELKTKHPATAGNIRWEMNRAHKSGIVFRKLDDPIPLQQQLYGLIDSHYRRLNGMPFPFGPSVLAALQRNLGERLVVYVALKDREPCSVTVVLRAGDSMFVAMSGTSEENRESLVYFNNTYDEPIKDAIGVGVRRIYCGKLLYGLKARRGFELLESNLYLRVHGRIRATVLKGALTCQPLTVRRATART
jgi:predicted N-acyltransferase